MIYLLKLADKDYKFGFKDELEQSECLQWLFFWHGGGAPYQGNLGFFTRAAEKIPCKIFFSWTWYLIIVKILQTCLFPVVAIERFRKETFRVFGVLEIRLSGIYADGPRDYLVGQGKGKYSIADIAAWTWVKNWPRGFTEEEMSSSHPHLLQWVERIAQRPAVKVGTGEKYSNKWKGHVPPERSPRSWLYRELSVSTNRFGYCYYPREDLYSCIICPIRYAKTHYTTTFSFSLCNMCLCRA